MLRAIGDHPGSEPWPFRAGCVGGRASLPLGRLEGSGKRSLSSSIPLAGRGGDLPMPLPSDAVRREAPTDHDLA